MSDKLLNNRQKHILMHCLQDRDYAFSDISEVLTDESPSAATLRRDIQDLCKQDYLIQTGTKKSARYNINQKKILFAPIDPDTYCAIEIDSRPGNSNYNFELFKSLSDPIFNQQEIETLNNHSQRFIGSADNTSPTLQKKELERFIIELSWKSSKIEGNTYSLLDTERLLKEGIEASGHSKEEAIMIINHKKAFKYILGNTKKFLKLSKLLISDLHRLLIEDLEITYGLRTKPVGITGTLYRPLSIPIQIEEALVSLCQLVNKQTDAYSKSLLSLAGIAYIQPFEDGNKRTSRLTANAILLAHELAPLSYRSVNEISYKEAMLVFYEKNSLKALKEIFIEQYIFSCKNYLKFS